MDCDFGAAQGLGLGIWGIWGIGVGCGTGIRIRGFRRLGNVKGFKLGNQGIGEG